MSTTTGSRPSTRVSKEDIRETVRALVDADFSVHRAPHDAEQLAAIHFPVVFSADSDALTFGAKILCTNVSSSGDVVASAAASSSPVASIARWRLRVLGAASHASYAPR